MLELAIIAAYPL